MTTNEEKRHRWFQIVEARRMAHRALGIEKGLVFVDKKANQFVFKNSFCHMIFVCLETKTVEQSVYNNKGMLVGMKVYKENS